jgi:hypothetical protein
VAAQAVECALVLDLLEVPDRALVDDPPLALEAVIDSSDFSAAFPRFEIWLTTEERVDRVEEVSDLRDFAALCAAVLREDTDGASPLLI